MYLIAVMTYIFLLSLVVVLTAIGSNGSTRCNGPNVCNGRNDNTHFDGHVGCDGYNYNITYLDIFGLSERPGTLTYRMISTL